MPEFSIVIPLYNKERDIVKTLNSVFLQTITDFEIVIVNDGSTDDSEAMVKTVEDSRILLFSKENEGVARTRNYGVSKATSAHIVFLDADDYWHPNHLENLKNLIEKFPEHKWYATAYEKKHNHKLITSMLSPVMQQPKGWLGSIDNYFENSLMDALAWTSAVCFKKPFFEALGGFDASITHGAGEDTDLWIRAALKAPLAFSNTITARHNLDGSNRISNTPTLTRNYMNTETYVAAAKKDPFLKKYLDRNSYSFAIQHKMANDIPSFKNYLENIDVNNLTTRQRFLLKQPRSVLKLLVKGKDFAEKLGVRLTAFK
ncbi:glycosyl transferase family 2 [Ulvibacter sp. MAR_2010_11]|uniref:glycosyltransferase family 2 protein n=1 Tax=Ulvibacter sp. MAR_2010_11 TaxID=1250229 RepID=UPI000C2B768A|nr:glycosyltransferase family A protein [Ulvibacter sp. MAR_2010_11]PKA83626.1 glycosyl transferase family 2 [Ulvibacter sp. MAR_2010_11]